MDPQHIYLIRHARAASRTGKKYPNDDRPLTADGRRNYKQAARGLPKVMDKPDIILSSPLSRAYETACITAKAFSPQPKIRKSRELLPGRNPRSLIPLLKRLNKQHTVVLCGHEPGLSQTLAALTGSHAVDLKFKKGSVAMVEFEPRKPFKPGQLVWFMPPRVLRILGRRSQPSKSRK